MTINEYIAHLERVATEELTDEFDGIYLFAKAYAKGEDGIKKYRASAIASKIGETYNQDTQLAILFNRDTHPDEYEAYQAFRTECKALVDIEIESLKNELEKALKEG